MRGAWGPPPPCVSTLHSLLSHHTGLLATSQHVTVFAPAIPVASNKFFLKVSDWLTFVPQVQMSLNEAFPEYRVIIKCSISLIVQFPLPNLTFLSSIYHLSPYNIYSDWLLPIMFQMPRLGPRKGSHKGWELLKRPKVVGPKV